MSIELVVTYSGEEQFLRVEDSDIISIPDGLIGMPDWHRFVLLEDPEEAPICVLQCLDDATVSFLVTDPWHILSGYKPDVAKDILDELGLKKLKAGRILCILAAKEGPVLVTANLLGPIIINPTTRIARQVVLQDSQYSAQYPVLVKEGADSVAKV